MKQILDFLQMILIFVLELFGKKRTSNQLSEPTVSIVQEDKSEVITLDTVDIISEEISIMNKITIPRSEDNISGNDFAKKIFNLKDKYRESFIFKEFEKGNVPEFLRTFSEIKIEDGQNTLIYYVSPDYMSIGDDSYYLRIPMTPITAQKIADLYNCILPTRKMVEQIYRQAVNKLIAVPKGPPYDDSMSDTVNYIINNQKIQQQLKNKDYTKLTAGHKKDIILSNKIAPDNPQNKVVIFGWFDDNGKIIQKLNAVSHSSNYSDYSHGTRLIYKNCKLNGNITNISDILQDEYLSSLISDENKMKILGY